MDGLTLVLGGARSGKSAFAERLAAVAGKRVLYVATAEPSDEEMVERIRMHRLRRPPEWRTIEQPLDPVTALRTIAGSWDAVLLDCVSIWISNHLLRAFDGTAEPTRAEATTVREAALTAVQDLLDWRAQTAVAMILVSSEVGLGLVPPFLLGRLYADLLGEVNQLLAHEANRVHLLVAGLTMDLK